MVLTPILSDVTAESAWNPRGPHMSGWPRHHPLFPLFSPFVLSHSSLGRRPSGDGRREASPPPPPRTSPSPSTLSQCRRRHNTHATASSSTSLSNTAAHPTPPPIYDVTKTLENRGRRREARRFITSYGGAGSEAKP